MRYIQPGKPDQNVFIERIHRSYREVAPSAHLFESIAEVQEITDGWLPRDNEIRPHDSLGSLPPARYREKLLAAEMSALRTGCWTAAVTPTADAG